MLQPDLNSLAASDAAGTCDGACTQHCKLHVHLHSNPSNPSPALQTAPAPALQPQPSALHTAPTNRLTGGSA